MTCNNQIGALLPSLTITQQRNGTTKPAKMYADATQITDVAISIGISHG
ncbi:MAG: hypothetical protein ACI9P7_001978 [Candidatus Azotimanducaceae bacterium]|jgi:hypothetical protein